MTFLILLLNFVSNQIKHMEKKNFIIETIQWKWSPQVKQKSIYRDDEFVRTKTKEEAIKAINFLMGQPRGLTYTITVFRDGEYFTYFRYSMPCYGGLAKYSDAHGKDKHFYNPYFPRDIYVTFPEGEIIFIGIYRKGIKKDLAVPYYDFILSQESPWVSAFHHRETIIFADNYFILTEMKTDPTVLYSLLRLGGLTGSIYDLGGKAKDINPKAQILLSKTNQASACRLAGQRPIRISGGSWAENFGYCRTYCESIFKRRLPDKWEDFGKHVQGYPQAPHDNKYFLRIMKENFGVDATKQEQKTYESLVIAWDFFKGESLKLGNGFPQDKSKIESVSIEGASLV